MTVGRISANGLQRKILSSLALKITDNDFKYSGYQKQRKPSHKEKKTIMCVERQKQKTIKTHL